MAEYDREVRSPWSSGAQNAEPGPNKLTHARIYRSDIDHAPPKPRADQTSQVQGMPVGVMRDKGRRP